VTRARILVDLSFFRLWRRGSRHFTGIPRVIFETSRRLAGDDDFEVVLVQYDVASEQFVLADPALLQPEPAAETGGIPVAGGGRRRDLLALPRRLWYGTAPARRTLRRLPGATRAYRGVRRRYSRLRGTPVVGFRPDDTLLLLDSIWGVPQMLPALGRMKERVGFRIATLIYDLIPVDYPHLGTPKATAEFEYFLRQVLPVTDQVFAISEASKRAVTAYCRRTGIPLEREVIAAPLGEGYENPHEGRRPRGLPDGDFIITVSTFEPRKNYQVLYHAVKHAQLLGMPLPRIVIVGRPGWSTEELQHLLRADPTTQDALLWLDAVSDDELAWLYAHALFTVFPSIAEGWGLPVSESIHFGRFCIASDQASLPEIAGDLIDYVSPYDVAGWAEAIARLAGDPALLAERTERLVREYRPRRWESFVDVLKAGIVGIASAHRA
jgi:glycosyltransferase involved in cell wall biosynthesis